MNRIANLIFRRDHATPAPSLGHTPSLGGFSWQSGGRPRATSETASPEGWHLSPTTPTLRITNPDLPLPTPTERSAPDYGKPLPELPPEAFQPHTPATISRTGSPEGNIDIRSVVQSVSASPVDGNEVPRVLRVMNPDPEPVPNFSRPFGTENPFPSRPMQPMPQRPTPYRAGLDPMSPMYDGGSDLVRRAQPHPLQSLPLRPAPYRPGLDRNSPLYRGDGVSSVPMRPYTQFRPAQNARPRPPLTPLVIPDSAPRVQAHSRPSNMPYNFPNHNDVPTGRPRFSVDSPIVSSPDSAGPVPRPENPTPYHPYNLIGQPTRHSHVRTPRSRGNTLATPSGLETIQEGNENAAKRKPAPPIPPPKDQPLSKELPPTPVSVKGRRLATLPKGLQWLDISSWGKRPTAKRSATRDLMD